MLRFYAEKFVAVAAEVADLKARADANFESPVLPEMKDLFFQRLKTFAAHLQEIRFTNSVLHCDRMANELNNPGMRMLDLHSSLRELSNRIHDDARQRIYFEIPPIQAHLLLQSDQDGVRMPAFGIEVDEAFPSAVIDIEESAKCWACGRSTACVLHAMRVMEVGLRALAQTLGISAARPSWDSVLDKIDKEITKRNNDTSKLWHGDEETFFADASARLRAVKAAWRNPVMHVDSRYNESVAIEIYSHVGAFMKVLATRIKE